MRGRTLCPAILAALPLVASGCSTSCELTPTLTEAAGSGATSCGSVALGGDTTAMHACVVAALRAGRPFWFAFQQRGRDSEVWTGLARASDATGHEFFYDGDPSGGGRVGARISRVRCDALRIETLDGREQVQCVDGVNLGEVCGPYHP